MPRTNAAAVETLLGPNWDGITDVEQGIDSASPIVDRVVAQAIADCRGALSTAEQEILERWLAAHFYCAVDPLYQSKNTDSASGQYEGTSAMGLQHTRYGQQAMRLDWTQCLRNLDEQQYTQAFWLGRKNAGPYGREFKAGRYTLGQD